MPVGFPAGLCCFLLYHTKGRMMGKVMIVGGGPAGMLAGVYAARKGNEVHIFEKK